MGWPESAWQEKGLTRRGWGQEEEGYARCGAGKSTDYRVKVVERGQSGKRTGLARGRIDKSFKHCARPGDSYLVLRWQFFQTFFVRTGMALEAYLNELPGCFHSLFYLQYVSLVLRKSI